jgi:hypothetical protein
MEKISRENFGEGKYFTLHKNVELRDHHHKVIEKGLFAKDFIKKGGNFKHKLEIVWDNPMVKLLICYKGIEIY